MSNQTTPPNPACNCPDNSGSDLADNLTISTFFYAVAVGLIIFLRSIFNSLKDMTRLLGSLQSDVDEISITMFAQTEEKSLDYDTRLQQRRIDVERAATHAKAMLGTLERMYYSLGLDSAEIKWTSRWRYVWKQRSLSVALAEKQLAMDGFRRARERYDLYRDELWKIQMDEKMQQQQEYLTAIMQQLGRYEENTKVNSKD